jgi:hypothetical protein
MREQPRMAWAKIAPQLLGIVALSAFFVTGTRSEPVPRMSFPEIARHLRVGMDMADVHAMLSVNGACPGAMCGSPYSWCRFYVDSEGKHELVVISVRKTNLPAGHYDQQLVSWQLNR